MKKLIAALFFLSAIAAHGASVPFTAFRGAGTVTITTNPTLGTVTITGSGTATNGQPQSQVLSNLAAIGISTTNVVWVSAAGNDATAARSRLDLPAQTLTKAKALSIVGDTINVLPGIYLNATNLLKNGVRWNIWGATFTNNSSGAGFWPMFTDNNTGMSNCDVTGYGTFVYNTLGFVGAGPALNYGCIFQTMHGSTDMKFEFNKAYAFGIDDEFARNIYVSNCLSVTIKGELNDASTDLDFSHSGMEFGGGVCRYEVTETYGDREGAINVDPSQSGTNRLEVAGSLFADHESPIKIQDGGSNYFCIFNLPRSHGYGNPFPTLVMESGNVVMNVDSVTSDPQSGDVFFPDANVWQTGGHLTFNAKRFETAWKAFYISGGTFNINVDELIDMGGKPRGAFEITNAMGIIRVGRSYQTNGWWMTYGGSNVTLHSSYVNMVGSAATNWGVRVLGSGFKLRDSVLVTPANSFSLDAPAAQNVTIMNGFANRAASNNVTVLVGPWTIDTNVQ